MKWVETIRIRIFKENFPIIKQELLTHLSKNNLDEGLLQTIKVFKQDPPSLDYLIYLEWNSEVCPPRGSALAQQLKESLTDFGMTHLSIWQEMK